MVRYNDNGVSHGSILGPLLFLIYKNDIPLIVGTAKTVLFVDNNTLTTVDEISVDGANSIKLAIVIAETWFNPNNLI